MITEDLLKQIEFIKEIDKIKYIQRKTKLFNSDRKENDAEHSWHLAMMAVVLSEYSDNKIDLLKVIKMVLIHDIVEIDAGDTFLYDKEKSHDNTEEEKKCAERIFGILPEKQATEFIEVWSEFENGTSNEAKFAKSLDNLEPILQNASNNGGTWKEFEVNYKTVFEKKKVIKKGSEKLWDFTKNILNDSVKKGILAE
ncbi:HD domain-containing protein [Aquimarina rubra]|uniref:HD family hydrolase n=1 Tax=Aquimarina rubra TaxID=1920033 RepID=A0ABW5LNK7_9FLAO